MIALDSFQDNLCLFRCLAVHRGAHPDRCTQQTEFLNANQTLQDIPKTSLDQLKKVEEHFKQGICIYEPTEEGAGTKEGVGTAWYLTRLPAHYGQQGTPPRTAFLIKDITKLANVYVCRHCNQRFIKADRCTKRQTTIVCPGEKVEAPQSAYEKAFYPKGNASASSIL